VHGQSGDKGLSQNDCFLGEGSGGGPADEDHMDRYCSRNVSVRQGHSDRMSSWRGRVLAAEARKAGIASDDTLPTPKAAFSCVDGTSRLDFSSFSFLTKIHRLGWRAVIFLFHLL